MISLRTTVFQSNLNYSFLSVSKEETHSTASAVVSPGFLSVTVVAVGSKYFSDSNHEVCASLYWWWKCHVALELLDHFHCQPIWMHYSEEILRKKSTLLQHMTSKHTLHIGLLDNIVNWPVFPCTLQRILDNLIFWHCETDFGDNNTLTKS